MSTAESHAILPEPPDELKQLSRSLTARLRERLGSDNFMPFTEYMEAALYEPGLGYYSAGSVKLGRAGDFVTAPELGEVFAHCLAVQASGIGADLGEWDLLEIGAGSGRLAAGLLVAMGEAAPRRYRILERSADLRAEQKRTLSASAPALLDRVEWLDAPPSEPWRGVVVANEVVDALPVERFRITGDGLEQVGVHWGKFGLEWATAPAPPALAAAVNAALGPQIEALPDGYTSEICTQLPAWLAGVTASLTRGVALLIDYGYPRPVYYRPERGDGTLVCHYRHRAHDDPFRWPGLQDITAFVDFTALAKAADGCGLDVAGYTDQARFLIACGLEDVLAGMETLPDRERFELAREVRELTLPGAMGEKFQAMALGRDFEQPLRGFALSDLRGQL